VALEPLVAREPVQPPVAVQAVALVDDQFRVEVPPLATLVGLALNETVGGVAETVTMADCDADPPAPVQVSVKVEVAVSAAVLCVPLIASAPLQPPDAVHEVALLDDQVNDEVAPLFTVLGFAEILTAGAAWVTVTVADCVALPPAPLQDNA
jgi:hypothetical protein